MALEHFGTDPQCAIRWDDRCLGYAEHLHELKKRSRGGDILDPANCVPACDPCNGAVEDYPAEARRRGWAVASWEDVA